uniref:Uncharacterized protein n=1 Tax=Myoviridae sp. ctbEa13 TaxID=2825136 RepID=A0A8S5VBJ8_9CAUD|nr:MAG TPA: hypothetical protein [Myoviridae sp. ctbEa13]
MKAQESRCHDCPYAVENSTSKKLQNLKKSYTNVLLYPKTNGDLFVRNVMHNYTDEDLNRFISFEYHCLRIDGRIVNFTKRGFVLTAWKITNLDKERMKSEVQKMFEEVMRLQTMTTYGMYSNPPQMPDTPVPTPTNPTTPITNSTNVTNASDTNIVDDSKANYKDTDSIYKEDSNK